MEEEFLAAVTEIIREQVVQQNEIKISGLGTFKREHIKQSQEQYESGRVVMKPPKDVIRFVPE
ncbi:MAG: HU family DNA-binding protein [Balneolaceae bacterium]|nr:HU family DNA-binding protein [Balneolaceae bacterium]